MDQTAKPVTSEPLSEDAARQGATGMHVRYVLLLGLFGSIFALALVAVLS